MEQDDPVERLFARAKMHGVPMYAICDLAGVARSTPSRWRQSKNGATVSTVASLDNALSRLIAAREPTPDAQEIAA